MTIALHQFVSISLDEQEVQVFQQNKHSEM